MAKFFRLVQNEHIKIFSRISTWILIGCMVLGSVGFMCFAKYAQFQQNSYTSSLEGYGTETEQDYLRQIEWLDSAKEPGYETMIEMYRFKIDNKIGYNDWRSTVAEEIFAQKQQLVLEGASEEAGGEQVHHMLTAVKNNDWKTYYTLKLNDIDSDPDLSKAQKEAMGYSYRYALEQNLNPAEEHWQTELVEQTATAKRALADSMDDQGQPSLEEAERAETLKNEILLNEYRLEHDIRAIAYRVTLTSMPSIEYWDALGMTTIMIGFISMIIIIFAGSSIANEFSAGTIKFLLINPVKRWKIFLSKYVTILSLSVMLVLSFYFLNAILAGCFFGFGDIMAPYLSVSAGVVHEIPGLLFILGQYLLGSINLIVMGTLAFAISSLLRNSAVAIGVSVFAMLAGNTIVLFMKGVLKLDWARFFIFANTDLNAIMAGDSIFPNVTVGFSLAVIAVHMVIFFLTAWDGFMRRESI